MKKIHIKPLSANDMWQGRRYKTSVYKRYERSVLSMLPNIKKPKGKMKLTLEVGFSSARSDLDNTIKPLLDIMQLRYGFNDNKIYEISATKKIVKKGMEYVSFKLEAIL